MPDSAGPATPAALVAAQRWEAAIRVAVRHQREARGWSLREAARHSGGRLKPTTLGAYERGDRQMSLTTLHVLADLYDVPVGVFIPQDGAREDATAQITRALGQLSDRHRSLLTALVEELQHAHPHDRPEREDQPRRDSR